MKDGGGHDSCCFLLKRWDDVAVGVDRERDRGMAQQRSWSAEDGNARSVVEVVADELGPRLRWATATYDQDKELVPQPATLPRARLPLADPSTVETLTSRMLGE